MIIVSELRSQTAEIVWDMAVRMFRPPCWSGADPVVTRNPARIFSKAWEGMGTLDMVVV